MADPTYTLPSVDELTELVIAYWGNLIPDDDLSRASDQWARSRVLALVAADVNENASIQRQDALPISATFGALDQWGEAVDRTRKGATVVTGADVLRIRGVVGTAYTIDLTLTHSSGVAYQLTDAGTIPGAGFVDVSITSLSTGARTRLTARQILRFDAPPVGLEQNAELQADLVDGGEDAEGDPAYRVRVLDSLQRRSLGNTAADWQAWALGVTGVAAAYVYRHRNGLGTVDVACFKEGHGDARALTSGERTDVLAALDARRPVTAAARVLDTIGEDVGVKALIIPMPGAAYAPDWSADGFDFRVAAWTSATRVLQLNANRPTTMRAGHRVVVNRGTGEEVVIQALGPAADEITIRAPLPSGWVPDVNDEVWTGGPLVAPVRLAISDWIDALGPAPGSYGSGWRGALYLGDLFLLVQTTTGVLDSEIRDLADATFTTVEATDYLFPDDDKIGYLRPGKILAVYTDAL